MPIGFEVEVMPPWYLRGWIIFPSGVVIFVALISSLFFGSRYYAQRRQILAYQRLAVEELQDARRVQMGLMPEVAPDIDGLEIAGKCLSANTVSGDFYDYLAAAPQPPIPR